jgi:hypothetical protein
MQQENDGIKWIEGQVILIAGELGMVLDGPIAWEKSSQLYLKMAVDFGGQRHTLKLSTADVSDSQGANKQPTLEVREKLKVKIRDFLESFTSRPRKARIGF